MSKAKKDPKPKAPTLATVIEVVDTNAQALATLASSTAEFADACEERFEELEALDQEVHSLSVTVSRGEADRERIEARVNALLRLVLETAAPKLSLWERIKERVQSYSVWSRDAS